MIYVVRSQKQSKKNHFQIENYTKKNFTTFHRNLQSHNDENIEDRNLRFFHKHSFEKIITEFNY